ncbi:efflux RND transporter periplasmic adaptor subunit [Nibrella saemangeumensis]
MKITFALAVALISGALLTGCQSAEKEKPRQKRPRRAAAVQQAVPVNKVTPSGEHSQQALAPVIQLPAEFRPYQEVNLFPKANGFITKVLVDRGSVVRKGQVLMVLEAPEIEEQLVAARSNYLKAKAVLAASHDYYHRLQTSSKVPGSVAPLDLEAARSRVAADSAAMIGENANYQALQKMKAYQVMRAPFNGVITERNVHPGALVGPGSKQEQPMLVLQDHYRLRLVVDVPETYSMRLREGSTVAFTVNAVPGKAFQGQVSRRSGRMNQQFRSETIEIDVPNPNRQFKPGMFAEIVLRSDEAPEAVAQEGGAIE